MYFLMTSLLYALYCFDYKWGLNNDPLVIRVAVVESNWAFFMGTDNPQARHPHSSIVAPSLLYPVVQFSVGCLCTPAASGDAAAVPNSPASADARTRRPPGFGAPCVFCSMVLPFYIGAGVVNFVYPLFVLVACDTDLHAAMKEGEPPALSCPLGLETGAL